MDNPMTNLSFRVLAWMFLVLNEGKWMINFMKTG